MRNVLTLSLLLLVANVFGQGFVGASVFPNPCYEQDSIFVLDTVQTAMAFDYRKNTKIVNRGDSIFINVCYKIEPGPTSGRDDFNKTSLGKLPKGSYTLILNGRSIYDDIQNCDSATQFYLPLVLSLEVKSPLSLTLDLSSALTGIRSNIVSDLLTLHFPFIDYTLLSIYDLTGRLHHSSTIKSSMFNLDVSDWSSGVYIVVVQVGQERKRWRVFKE